MNWCSSVSYDVLRRRNAVRIADLSEVDFTLVALPAGVMAEVLDGQAGFRKHRKQNVLIVAHDVQRQCAGVVHVSGRIDRLGGNVRFDKRRQKGSPAMPQQDRKSTRL